MKKAKHGLWLLVLCSCLTGCAGAVPRESATAFAAPPEKVVIWAYYETQAQREGLTMLVDGFNSSQQQYQASWEYKGPYTDFVKQLSLGIAEQQLPDMVVIDNPDMRAFAELGWFEDITAYAEGKADVGLIYPEVWSSVSYNGKCYGMPFCCNNVGLIYNKDMLAAANIEPPTTWEEFLAAAKALTTDTVNGFAMSAISGEQSAFQMLPWILSTGENLEHPDGEQAVKAYELIQALVESGAMSKDCINWSQNDVALQLAAGKCAMIENGPWVLPLLEESGVPFGIVKLPVDRASIVVQGGENLAVMKGKNVAGALALLDYYYTDNAMLAINATTYSLPPKRDLAFRIQEQNPVYRVFVQQMDQCVSRPGYSTWAAISPALSKTLYNVIVGTQTPGEAATQFAEAAQP